jgi:hypothetical protein
VILIKYVYNKIINDDISYVLKSDNSQRNFMVEWRIRNAKWSFRKVMANEMEKT